MKRLLPIVFTIVVAGAGNSVYAQGCSICTKTAAGLGEKSARGLNGGIIYLAMVPLAIVGTLGAIWWKHNKDA